jgi:hypothetical protein
MVRFSEDIRSEDLLVNLFKEWLRSILAAVEEVCVKASFKCFSTLLLITAPLPMYPYILQHPAIFFLGAVTSSIVLPEHRKCPFFRHNEETSSRSALAKDRGKIKTVSFAEFEPELTYNERPNHTTNRPEGIINPNPCEARTDSNPVSSHPSHLEGEIQLELLKEETQSHTHFHLPTAAHESQSNPTRSSGFSDTKDVEMLVRTLPSNIVSVDKNSESEEFSDEETHRADDDWSTQYGLSSKATSNTTIQDQSKRHRCSGFGGTNPDKGEGEEDRADNGRRKRQKDNTSPDATPIAPLQTFACPFFKMNPLKYSIQQGQANDKQYRVCAGPGWKTIQLLK